MILKQYISYQIAEADIARQEILIATLSDWGFDGFEQNDTSLTANGLMDAVNGVETEDYLHSQHLSFKKQIITEQNWNEQWEQSFQPIVIENFCAVRASFHQPVPDVLHDIIITPKMSFGTGHHATTYMMLQAMEQIEMAGKTVIDFGTGTTVLAILAEKLGAATITAIDNDDWCIENGAENMVVNNCTRIHLQKASNLLQTFQADILLANINKHVILFNLPTMKEKLKKGGILLISGILKADEQDITKAASESGLEKTFSTEKVGWLCICFKTAC